jgi:NADH:ubiquinone reductase (non-electrogenic)
LLKNSDLKHRKERVVVLGTGWGAVAAMRNLDPFKFEIVCVSPRNYFVMTPLLPSVTVGTIEPRTVVESIRNVCPHVKFVEAECTGLSAFSTRMPKVLAQARVKTRAEGACMHGRP